MVVFILDAYLFMFSVTYLVQSKSQKTFDHNGTKMAFLILLV